MKTLLHLCFCLVYFSAKSQNVLPHQSERPPVNPYGSFTRSMVIDCSDDIISDLLNGSPQGRKQDLISYIGANYIGYIAMDGLYQTWGNTLRERCLKQLLRELHTTFPGIEIGAVGSLSADFRSMVFKIAVDYKPMCDHDAQSLGDYFNTDFTKLATVNQIFLFAATLSDRQKEDGNQPCYDGFDALLLDNRYWMNYAGMTDAQTRFRDYISSLELMRKLKCSYGCIKYVDAVFLPVTEFRNIGWTETDQITEVDLLADRIILPAFTNNVGNVYDGICRYFHLFTDRFTKNRSRIFIGCSAESQRFALCDGNSGSDHLGDYLDQTGNIYSAEQILVDQLNDASYSCTYCNCNTNATNQYTNTNRQGNELMGTMWFYYSVLKANSIYRIHQERRKDNIGVSDILGRQ